MVIQKNNINGVTLNFPDDLPDIEHCIEVMNRKKVEVICADKAFIKDDRYSLSFLDKIKYPLCVKEILVGGYYNIEPLYRFRNVEILGGDPPNGEIIDLSKFLNLKYLCADTLQGFTNLDRCYAEKVALGDFNTKNIIRYEKLTQLKFLKDLRVYPATGFTFDKITELTKLEKLVLTNGNYKDLVGINNLSNLNFIWICNNRSLQSIKNISSNKSLNQVYIENCPKLDDLSELGEMEQIIDLHLENIKKCNFNFLKKLVNLRRLGLYNCGEIESLKFIENLPKLISTSIYGTNVIDGDLTLLKSMKFVHISDKRHYNLKSKDFIDEGNYSWSAKIENFM